jgi:hypothetical protein
LAVAVIAALALGGCSNIKNKLGFGKNSPDEFAVATRAPLTVPPDFRLRPPTPGVQGSQQDTAQDRARLALTEAGANDVSDGVRSAGETAILAQARTDEADTDIRRILEEENAILFDENGTLLSRIMFWREKEPPGTVIEPTEESQRIQEASALGLPPGAGESAIIERREKGLLEGIF